MFRNGAKMPRLHFSWNFSNSGSIYADARITAYWNDSLNAAGRRGLVEYKQLDGGWMEARLTWLGKHYACALLTEDHEDQSVIVAKWRSRSLSKATPSALREGG